MSAINEKTSWQELARRLRPFIARRIAVEADADDILQDVFFRMHRGMSKLTDETRLSAWMFQITRNAIADHLRERARHPLTFSDASEVEHFESPTQEEDDAMIHEVARYLSCLVAFLPSPYREAITLVEIEGHTQKEAARMLGISLSGMKSRVQRGRARLRQMLEENCELALDARGRVISCVPRPLEQIPVECQCQAYCD